MEKLEIGQQVFVVNENLEIEEKEILALIKEKDKTLYKLDEHSCGGWDPEGVFTTKPKAEKFKQDFLDQLRFKVGDLVVFKLKEYGRNLIEDIGRISKIKHKNKPYTITTAYSQLHDVGEDLIAIKVRNDYIENFGNIQELYKEFEDKIKEINFIAKQIHKEHEKVEKELNKSFHKQYSVFNFKREKPLFKDRFNYEGDTYYD